MAKTPEEMKKEIAELKEFKQIEESRIIQIMRLMKSEEDFKSLLESFKVYGSAGISDDDNIKIYQKISQLLNMGEEDRTEITKKMDNVGPGLDANAKNAAQAKVLALYLVEYLRQQLDSYRKHKTDTDILHKDLGTSTNPYPPSKRRKIYDELAKQLQSAPAVNDWAGINNLRETFLKLDKIEKIDLRSYFKHREERLKEKEFLVEGLTRNPQDPYRAAQIIENKNAHRIGSTFTGASDASAALIRQYNYTRTGYGDRRTTLLRAYNIGFNQDEILEAMRTLDPEKKLIDILPGKTHVGAAENPTRKITFMFRNEPHGVTARQTNDNKIEYLCYKLSDYEQYKTTLSDKQFIAQHARPMSGDDCNRKLDNPKKIEYAHRPGDFYDTVEEALNEQYHHFARAAGIDEVYTNLKEYPDDKAAAAMKLNKTTGAGGVVPSSAIGTEVSKKDKNSPPSGISAEPGTPEESGRGSPKI